MSLPFPLICWCFRSTEFRANIRQCLTGSWWARRSVSENSHSRAKIDGVEKSAEQISGEGIKENNNNELRKKIVANDIGVELLLLSAVILCVVKCQLNIAEFLSRSVFRWLWQITGELCGGRWWEPTVRCLHSDLLNPPRYIGSNWRLTSLGDNLSLL